MPQLKKLSWKTKKLGEVCAVINRGISPKYIPTRGIQVLNQKCIRNHIINYDLSQRHDANAKNVNTEKIIQVGDVLVNSTGTGTLGRVAQVRNSPSEMTTVDSHITIVRPQKNLFFNDFFGYALIKIEEEIKTSGEGASGQTELSRRVLQDKFTLSYPESLEEQKRIVKILDEVFEGIEKAKENTEKNVQNSRELFEAYLQNVFTKSHESWHTDTLGTVCQFQGGSQPPKDVFIYTQKPNYIRLIQIRDYKTDKFTVYIPIDQAKRFCNPDDVMIGRYGPPIFQILRGLKGAYNVALMKAIPDENKISKDFLYFFLKHKDIQNYVIKLSSRAAGQSGLNKETLEPYIINYPSLESQKEIVKKIKGLEEKTKKLEENYKQKLLLLEELKKSVLQKAFSGEL